MPPPARSLLLGTRDASPIPVELALLALRVLAGLGMALGHGLAKMPPPARFVDVVAGLGLPAPVAFAWAAGISELAGGLLLALGLLTRPAALAVACTMAVAGFLRHAADPFRVKELAFLYLAVMAVFVVRGGGRFSLDRLVLRARGVRS